MEDIYISLSDLRTVDNQLQSIIDEFKNAVDRSEALEGSIGDPFGRGELREKAEDFEERWDNKREQLREGLEEVRKHVDGVVKAVEKWDRATAIELSSARMQISIAPRVLHP